MSNTTKDIEVIVNDITKSKELTQSQLDRLNDPFELLTGYLTSHLRKISMTSSLKKTLEEQFETDLSEHTLNKAERMALYEILVNKETKQESDVINAIAKAMTAINVNVPPQQGKGDTPPTSTGVTKEMHLKAKDALEVLDELKRNGILDEIRKGEGFFKQKED
jgi:hypothetical protein